MKKIIYKAFMIFSVVLIMLMGSIREVSASTKRISLINAVVKEDKGGLVLTFIVYGDFNKFSGYVRFGGKQHQLSCHLRKNTNNILVCRGADHGLSSSSNKTIQVVVNGFSFTTYINYKEAKQPKDSMENYCYPVFGLFYVSQPPPMYQQQGTHCQNTEANEGDQIYYYNPTWSSSDWYTYHMDGTNFTPGTLGPGYYDD